MRYLGQCALWGLVFLACTPTVGSNVPPDLVTARFDPAAIPPDVPAPTDLAKDPTTGLLAIPVSSTASAAEREFVEKFLNTLGGFPPDTPATANFDASLQPSSVNRSSVRVIDLTSRTPVALTPIYADVGSPPKGQITIPPPPPPSADQPGGWTIGHQYMVALIAGASGLIGLQGQQVGGSSAWALLASVNPLVTCPDNLADPNCRATTDLIPSDEKDPASRIADQTAKAKQLEHIRQGYAPLIKLLTDQGINRSDIVLLWTFTILARPQATFDPANQVIPFPNNLATMPLPDGGVRVNLPIPDGGSPLVQQLFQGLNTLDGFSTTAPIVSENSDPLPALTKGVLDPTTIVDGGTGVLNLQLDGGIQPRIRPCLTDIPNGNCATFTTPDGGAPEQLQLIPTVPLLERTTYVAYFTTKLKDTQGNGVAPTTAFALMRNRYPLVDGSGNSTISTVPSQLAADLEKARLVMKNGLDILESAAGVTREQLVLATVFTTQTEGTAIKRLRGAVNAVPATPVEFPIYPPGCRTCVGRIIVPNLLTGPEGVFDPSNPRAETISFTLFIPAGSPPPGGWPMTIFGHGLTRAQSDAFVLSFLFNQEGQALIATDAVWHGDRTICTGSAPFINSGANTDPACPRTATSDDAACANPATQFCCEDPSCPLFQTSSGRCVARNPANRAACDPASVTPPGTPPDIFCGNRGQGRCITNPDMTMSCEGGYFKLDSTPGGSVPCVSGQNLLNLTNLFTTRDNFRQQAIDLTQLARVIQANVPGSLDEQLSGVLNRNQISYAGMSLGGILGTLYTSVAPEIQNVVLNVPGSDLATILLTSPTFRPARAAFLDTLAEQGIFFGTPAFDDFVGVAKWILDPADPINGAYGILNDPTVPTTRKALIQYITSDQVVPNPTTEELIQAAQQTVPTGKQVDVCRFDPPVCDPDVYPNPVNCPCPGGRDSPTCSIPPDLRHGFLLNYAPPVFRDSRTTRAQTQAARYLKNPGGLTCTP